MIFSIAKNKICNTNKASATLFLRVPYILTKVSNNGSDTKNQPK